MSITEDIASLINRTNALLTVFDTKAAAINKALATALSSVTNAQRIVYVDPVLGNDANVGSLDAPFLTLDYAASVIANDTNVIIRLLGDCVMQKRWGITCLNFEIVGVRRDATSSVGVTETVRSITLLEASNLRFDGARTLAGFDMGGGFMQLKMVSIKLPLIPNLTVIAFVGFTANGSLVLRSMTIDAATSANTSLADCWSPAVLTFGATGVTITDAAKGKVLAGVASGGNPNSLWQYRSNLTAV